MRKVWVYLSVAGVLWMTAGAQTTKTSAGGPGCAHVSAKQCVDLALEAMGGSETLQQIKSVRLEYIWHTLLVHHRRMSLDFPMRPLACSAWGERGISRFPCKVLRCVHGVCDRAGSLGTSRYRRLGWCLPLAPTASASRSDSLTRLNTRPAPSPVNASMSPSRAAPHDLGPLWFANPSTYETFIHNTSPV
jgi:hypothetical protein